MDNNIKYPEVRRDEKRIDVYHSVSIPDPYHWLENPDSEETEKFVEDQNTITVAYLKDCDVRQRFYDRLKNLWNYPKYNCPFKSGSRYFYFHNSGLQNQSVLYVQKSWNENADIFLDPNKLAADGTISMKNYSFAENGDYFAYGLSKNGSDWYKIKFMKVENKEELPDVLENVKFSCMSWTHDHKGLFYNMYPKTDGKQDGTETSTNLHQKLYYHVLGTEQSEDVLCLEFPENPKWHIGAEVSDDGRYVVITVLNGCDPVNKLYYVDLEKLDYKITGILPYTKIVDNFDAEYEYVTNNNSVFTFKTNLNAPRYKIINIDFNQPDMENWKTLIEQDDNNVIEWVSCVHDTLLVVCYVQDVKNKLYLHTLIDGKRIKELPLDVGTIKNFSGKRTQDEIFYSLTSFLTPEEIYHCSLQDENYEPTIHHEVKVDGFNASNFETDQVFIRSKDGTRIPVFIIHKKDMKLDGSHPCLLYGYGGFNISIMPSFSIKRIIFMQNLGGVLAFANIRGGGEYGEDWHRSGTLAQKQNVFDDFVAASEYLIESKYTSRERLTIEGGSNGGLLVAACANQRPDLYKCIIANVGVLDMLKFHKFTIGHAWTTDYGCSDNKDDFQYLIKYSPLHNIRRPEKDDVQYPAFLLLTADHDDRVVPLHSFKFIAELQNQIGRLANQTNPLLIRICTEAGHGGGKPITMLMDEAADTYAFLARNVKAVWRE